MTTPRDATTRLYSALLRLYPREFRLQFGEEMTQVFADQVAEARDEQGIAGVMRVCCEAVAELFTVALPSQLANVMVIVPVLSFLSALALFLAVFWGLSAYNAIPHHFGR